MTSNNGKIKNVNTRDILSNVNNRWFKTVGERIEFVALMSCLTMAHLCELNYFSGVYILSPITYHKHKYNINKLIRVSLNDH